MGSFMLTTLFVCVSAVTSKSLSPPKSSAIALNNGYNIPAIGLGTSRAKATECEQAVKDAIDVGYRHIDSAYSYGNEREVGNAVRSKIDEGVITREDMFITTKLWQTFHDPKRVAAAFQKSFDNLNLTYIDLYLLHWPMAFATVNKDGSNTYPKDVDDVEKNPIREDGLVKTVDIDFLDTWHAMEGLLNDGRVRSIGVSNFNSQQIDRLLSVARIKPVTNQVECHPNFNQLKLLKFCADRNITLTAYSPLGGPHTAHSDLAINDPKVHAIAETHKKSPVQVVLRYTYQNGAIVIPKSTNRERMKNNFDIFDFVLSEEEMQIMNGLNNNKRLIKFSIADHDKYYPFNAEF